MVVAEFTEREYELQFNLELGAGKLGAVWTSGQVLEAIVGYDAVADPDGRHVVWRILQVPRPSAIRLAPHHWPGSPQPPGPRLPRQPISLVLQYKRPDFLRGPRAGQWRYWQQPYFRFARSRAQHATLRRLERGLGDAAVVRYAAPAYWTRSQLEANAAANSIIQRSGFLSPNSLGIHRVWTYVEPGVEGYANPERRPLSFASAEEIRGLLLQSGDAPDLRATTGEELRVHLAEAGAVSRRREPSLRADLATFERNLRMADIPLLPSGIASVVDLASITSVVANVGAIWSLAGQSVEPYAHARIATAPETL